MFALEKGSGAVYSLVDLSQKFFTCFLLFSHL
jgi:hypothetical protein